MSYTIYLSLNFSQLFTIFILDKEKPVNVKCPDNIKGEIKMGKDSVKIGWKTPTYRDNCGEYPFCKVDVIPQSTVEKSLFLQFCSS